MHDNPYAAPMAEAAAVSPQETGLDYKTVLRRWERLRILYNVLMALAGALPFLATVTMYGPLEAIFGAILYGGAANLCYSFGPLCELYLNWFTDAAVRRSWPWPATFVRSAAPTVVLFLLGTICSILLTLLAGLAAVDPFNK